MNIDYPRMDITKFLLSTPSYISGVCKSADFYLIEAYPNYAKSPYRPHSEERIFKQYVELAVITPKYDDGLIVPDYTHIAENFCIALSIFFGKRFDSHGLIQQHGRGHVPVLDNPNYIYNKNLCFNSLDVRSDYSISLELERFGEIHSSLFKMASPLEAKKTFFYAGRFYAQALRQVETAPEIAFLSLITVAEILAAHFNYPIDQLIDERTKLLLQSLRSIKPSGEKLAKQVESELYGVSEGVCKYILECLDDDFFLRGEAKSECARLKKADIKQRLKAAYNMRSQFVHAGKFQSNWMSVNYLNNNEEIMSGEPVIEDSATRKMIMRSPTFIGMERIIRYVLIKFLIKTSSVDENFPNLFDKL